MQLQKHAFSATTLGAILVQKPSARDRGEGGQVLTELTELPNI